jgi:hypothetical protein
MFLMNLCACLATQISGINNDRPIHERLSLATMSVSRIFAEVSSRNKNFGEFCSLGSYHERVQKYFLGIIGKEIEENAVDYSKSLAAYFPNVNSETLQPFMTKMGPPNILCFFHLVFQSLKQDFVCPSFLHC